MKSKSAIFFALSLATLFPLIGEEETSCSTPTVRDSSHYVDLGLGPFPIPLPVFGIGHREQWNHHGLDFNIDVSTIVAVTELKANALYLHYFKPNLASQFYVGGGIGGGFLFRNHRHIFHDLSRGFVSPEFVFGKQYTNEACDKRFFQAQISWPTFSSSHVLYFPLVVISYGFMF